MATRRFLPSQPSPTRRGGGRAPAPRRRAPRREQRTLALASGGIAGLLYELGVLEALDEACQGFKSTDFDVFMGVGSGAAAAALLANGVPPREIALAFEGQSKALPPFQVEELLQPNYGELWQKGIGLGRALWHAVQENVATPSELSLQDMLLSLTGVLPSGLYVTRYVESYLRQALSRPGMSDDFEALARDLVVVATEVDSGRSVDFGRGDGLDVPISRAVAATAATPMLFAPVVIGGRRFIDGTTTKMLHLSLPLSRGATFIFCVSPFRPMGGEDDDETPNIADSGAAYVAKQALRTLLHNRLEAGLAQYTDRPKAVDIVLVEPGPHDDNALWYNARKARTRSMLKEAGYMRGRAEIERHRAVFARHGVALRPYVAPLPRRGRGSSRLRVLGHKLEVAEMSVRRGSRGRRPVARRAAR